MKLINLVFKMCTIKIVNKLGRHLLYIDNSTLIKIWLLHSTSPFL